MIDRHARTGQEAGDGGDIEDAAAVPGDAVEPAQRQVGERADVEIDHGELLGAVEIGGLAEQAEAGIVDHDRGLEAGGAQGVRQPRRAVGLAQIGGDHVRARMTGGGDLVGQGVQLRLAPRGEHQRVAVLAQRRGRAPRRYRRKRR